MNLSLSWLADFIDPGLPVDELDALLHRTGLKVERISTTGLAIEKVVVGRILESEPHPNADRLSVCRVECEAGGSPRQIVCGAKNYRVGDKVPVALPGAVLSGNFKIKTGKLRGVESEGMMCSAKELELPGDDTGLLILSPEAPVGEPVSVLFPPQTVLELEITPNRPDWLSHLGVARELGAFLRRPVNWCPPVLKAARVSEPKVAGVEAGTACAFYSVRRISGVRVGSSPDWLRQRIEAIGLRAINNVVDITNYVLHELGQPLHAFDAGKVSGPLQIRQARDGEKFSALDGREYSLTREDTVIADEVQVLALGGVMGGQDSGVTSETTEILLESAYFEPGAIRRTARRLGLSSDSSYRFERGVDPEMVVRASARATELVLELAGGVAGEELFVAGAWTQGEGAATVLEPAGEIAPLVDTISLRHERCRGLLGLDLSDEAVCGALERAGLIRKDDGSEGGRSVWLAPSFRTDLFREVDLIEEVARLTGIEAIPGRVSGPVHPELDSDRSWDFTARLRGDLIRLGFFETRLSTLVGPDQLAGHEDRAVRLKNPLGEEQSWLRPSLLPGLLACARRNFHQGASSVRIFETGAIFAPVPEGTSGGAAQRQSLGILACGTAARTGWMKQPVRDDNFHDVLGMLQSLAGGKWTVTPSEFPGWVRAGRLCFLGEAIGWIGILAPSSAREIDAPGDVILAEVDLTPLVAYGLRPSGGAHPLPKFPAVTRDLALVLDEGVAYARVEECLRGLSEPLCTGFAPVDLFSDSTGEKLPVGKKSLAVSLTFQSSERTLTTEEIEKALDRIRAVCRDQLGAGFRE